MRTVAQCAVSASNSLEARRWARPGLGGGGGRSGRPTPCRGGGHGRSVDIRPTGASDGNPSSLPRGAPLSRLGRAHQPLHRPEQTGESLREKHNLKRPGQLGFMQESGSPKERALELFLRVYYVTQKPFQLQKHGGLMATGDRAAAPSPPVAATLDVTVASSANTRPTELLTLEVGTQ